MGFVIEGFNDEKKVKEVMPNAHCVVTKGTRMNGRVKMDLKKALTTCEELFLLTDPDEAGDKLAEMVLRQYPSLQRVVLDRNACLCYRNQKVKVGVEHCETSYLKRVLSEYVTTGV
ncbi:toprim domain-containing protein [Brevibacillus sp. NPDC058079]|uniref:toprim domain-containing protein n=1 Tax=Brevibacillus sp. NPDC058079 TaxID=3346330 RepID=UPI0036E687B2